jgi:hypothetical protein
MQQPDSADHLAQPEVVVNKSTPIEKFNASAYEHAVERKQIPAAPGR